MTMLLPLAGALLAAALATAPPAPPAPPAAPTPPATTTTGQRCVTTTHLKAFDTRDADFETHRVAIDRLLADIARRSGAEGAASALAVPPGTTAFAVTLEHSACGPLDARAPALPRCVDGDCVQALSREVFPEGSALTVTACTRGTVGPVTRASTSRWVDGRWAFQRAESALADTCPDAP